MQNKSKIEDLIEEFDDFVEGCKFKPFSSTVIMVDRDELLQRIRDLRTAIPEEVEYCQSIVSNRESILRNAEREAEKIVQETKEMQKNLLSETEIMQKAYAKANEVVTLATQNAQEIIDSATIEANNMKSAATGYTDGLLAQVEEILTKSSAAAAANYEELLNNLSVYNNMVKSNRAELVPSATAGFDTIQINGDDSNEGSGISMM